MEREAVFCRAGRLHLDLHAAIHPGRTFAPARLARDAKRKRLRHLVRAEGIGTELAGYGEAAACSLDRA